MPWHFLKRSTNPLKSAEAPPESIGIPWNDLSSWNNRKFFLNASQIPWNALKLPWNTLKRSYLNHTGTLWNAHKRPYNFLMRPECPSNFSKRPQIPLSSHGALLGVSQNSFYETLSNFLESLLERSFKTSKLPWNALKLLETHWNAPQTSWNASEIPFETPETLENPRVISEGWAVTDEEWKVRNVKQWGA